MRKRNRLDTAEANYVYAKLLIGLNKTKRFETLSLPERNKTIDDLSGKIIRKTNSPEDAEAILFEITAYKMTDEERQKTLAPDVYDANFPKPKGFNQKLKEKYDEEIKRMIEEFDSD
jgi:hypothetical protein